MIQIAAAFCYSAFVILAVASPFMPLFLMWRLASLSAFAYAAGKLIEGPVHWSDQNIGYAIGTAIIFLFSCTIFLAVVIRLAISAWRKKLSINTLRGPMNRFMLFFDAAALISIGCIFGFLVMFSLSFGLSGTAMKINLDLTIAILASIFAAILLFLSRSHVAVTITATFCALALLAFTGSRQPSYILTSAERLADGRAWCLTTSNGLGPISEPHQLGFFALPKGKSYPHLGLLIRENDQTAFSYHWSIRQQAFDQTVNTTRGVPSCHPIENFAEALTNGSVKDDTYGVGSKVYSIKRDLHPRAFTNRVSIRSNQLIGPNSAQPEITERITLTYNSRGPYAPEDAVPLSMMPDPNRLNAEDLTGQNRLVIAGFDELTGQRLVLNCLSGPYANRVCYAQVLEDLATYAFYLPLSDINQWQDATARVKALFESLEVGEL